MALTYIAALPFNFSKAAIHRKRGPPFPKILLRYMHLLIEHLDQSETARSAGGF